MTSHNQDRSKGNSYQYDIRGGGVGHTNGHANSKHSNDHRGTQLNDVNSVRVEHPDSRRAAQESGVQTSL